VIDQLKGWLAIQFAKRFDRIYNIDTFGQQSVSQSIITSPSKVHGQGFGSIPVGSFRALMRRLPYKKNEFVFIDYGCGKGRALFLAAEHDFGEVVGVEYAADLANIAKRNIELSSNEFRMHIACIEIDAVDYDIPDDRACLLFLYSPFQGPILDEVLHKIAQSHRQSPRAMILCYARQRSRHSPNHRSAITANPAFAQIGEVFSPFDLGALPAIEFTLFKVGI